MTPQLKPDDDAPVPAGGSLAEGKYQLTAIRVFGDSASGTDAAIYAALRAKETLEVVGGKWRIAYHYEGGGATVNGAHAGTFTTDAVAKAITGTETCESGDGSNGVGGFLKPYTADTTAGVASLNLFMDDNKEIVFTYGKL